MSILMNAMQADVNKSSYTDNGALTNTSTLDNVLDFFFVGPVAKKNPKDAVNLFQTAYHTDREKALRTLLWLRDARKGAGARQAFRDCFAWLMDYDANAAIAVLDKTAFVGRWDDVFVGLFSKNKNVQNHVIDLVRDALFNKKDALCAKWAPRRGPIAAALRSQLGLSPKAYRKLIVELSKTVETQMCANEWDEINYSHVPSVAYARYRKAFKKHDETRFNDFVNAAVKGEVKVNASAIYPHDVVKGLSDSPYYVNSIADSKAIDAQWKNLPNYMEDGDNVLVVADTSGSMSVPVSGSTTALHVCIALAMYMAERSTGIFKDKFVTFSNRPSIQSLTGTSIVDRYNQLLKADWDYNTNLQAVFDLVLYTAVTNGISEDEMPSTILIMSDMEFDVATGSAHNQKTTNFDEIRKKYANAGYKMPRLVFWNLNGRMGNMPATKHDKDVALVSGFSPIILESIFKSESLTPISVMLQTIMNERYDLQLD